MPSGAAAAPQLQLHVLVGHALVVRAAPELTVTLRLENAGDTPAYVSPAIGHMASILTIRARRVGSPDPAEVLFSRATGMRDTCWDIDDLFKLLPGRHLELSLPLALPKTLLSSRPTVDVEFWADYDFSGMKRVSPKAAAAHLTSQKTVGTLEFTPK